MGPSHPEMKIPRKLRLKVYRSELRYGVVWACLSEELLNMIPDCSKEWEKRILSEDRRFIESQKPEVLLDLALEVYVRADKASVALRKWMIDVGLGRNFAS